MKNNDVIRICANSIYLQFLTTGESKTLTVIVLNKDIQFKHNGLELQVLRDAQIITLEKFSSEALANSAYMGIQQKLNNYFKWHALLNILKGFLKWGLLPLFILFFALALNGIIARSLNAPALTSSLPALTSNSLPVIPQALNAPTAAPVAANNNGVPSSELSKAMADGAKAGKFSVQLSSGTAGTLYVFSDPLCPHCRDIEPELEKLAQNYTIHVFPVSIIGGTRSAPLVSSVLCLPPAQRVAAWKKAVAGESLDTSSCENGDKAFGANDQIFRTMQFPGTPQIIAENGQIPGADVEFTAAGLANWYKSL